MRGRHQIDILRVCGAIGAYEFLRGLNNTTVARCMTFEPRFQRGFCFFFSSYFPDATDLQHTHGAKAGANTFSVRTPVFISPSIPPTGTRRVHFMVKSLGVTH